MCFAQQLPQDNSAELARQEQQAREGRINQGKAKIDTAFNVFDPAYFQQYKDAYLANYNPQVDQQFTDARQKLIYNTARRGVRDSTPGQTEYGHLTQAYGDRRREVASNAEAATNQLRGQIDTQKGQLYDQNLAAADPSLSAVRAASAAGALQTAPAYSPLADLFSGLVNAGNSYLAGQQRGLPAGYAPYFAPGATTAGSGRVVT